MQNKHKQNTSIEIAKQVFDIEAESLAVVKNLLDESFDKAVNLMLQVTGRVVVTGMG